MAARCRAHHGLQLRVAWTSDQGAEQCGYSGDFPRGFAPARRTRSVVEVGDQEELAVEGIPLAEGIRLCRAGQSRLLQGIWGAGGKTVLRSAHD